MTWTAAREEREKAIVRNEEQPVSQVLVEKVDQFEKIWWQSHPVLGVDFRCIRVDRVCRNMY